MFLEKIGKKQRNIREENKKAVLDLLTEKPYYITEMMKVLKLSHPAITDILFELIRLGIVKEYGTTIEKFGRPSMIYGINPDCAITVGIDLSSRKISIFIVSMTPIQINTLTIDNDWEDLDKIGDFLANSIKKLIADHEGAQNKPFRYIYVAIPQEGVNGVSFSECEKYVSAALEKAFQDVKVVVDKDINLTLQAEKRYGILKDNNSNAIMMSIDRHFSMAMNLNGNIYYGDNGKAGLFCDKISFFDIMEVLKTRLGNEHLTYDEIFCKYSEEEEIRKIVDELFSGFIKKFRAVLTVLDVNIIILCGAVLNLGEKFIQKMESDLQLVNPNIKIYCSNLGEFAPLNGAVRMAAYRTIQELAMVRSK